MYSSQKNPIHLKPLFLDKEALYSKTDKNNLKPKGLRFVGKRIQRGLFKTQHNVLINADINGALNIARKVWEKVFT